ncbi:hypothetical protein BCT86_13020 [Vibrio breoganii]|uniref:hypothetical protein n=1 Tax=Vibrio breoganii TaxID=553239 RepID=UPI000C8221FC|nr:hypothetical protein [Vibrio breoganii]PML05253.1 hypothetical protein BCT86_13020 [Vibrio breoganii]
MAKKKKRSKKKPLIRLAETIIHNNPEIPPQRALIMASNALKHLRGTDSEVSIKEGKRLQQEILASKRRVEEAEKRRKQENRSLPLKVQKLFQGGKCSGK